MPSDSPAANVPSAPGLPGRSAPLDTTLVLVSPENIAFEYRLAGPAPRAIAFLIDLMLLVAVGGLTLLVASVISQGALLGFWLAGGFFLWWGGSAAVEVLANGQTPGKRALGIRVVSQDGLSINVSQSILRNFLRAIDLAPPFLPGLVSIGFTPSLALVEALASYVGRRRVLGPARRQEIAAIAGRRLTAAWGVPPSHDDDALLCAVYEQAIREPRR